VRANKSFSYADLNKYCDPVGLLRDRKIRHDWRGLVGSFAGQASAARTSHAGLKDDRAQPTQRACRAESEIAEEKFNCSMSIVVVVYGQCG
jgi:hypothetical protein